MIERFARSLPAALAVALLSASAFAEELDKDPTHYPWSAVGQVRFTSGGYCSGTLVGSNLVLTAAHCLYNQAARDWYSVRAVSFSAGRAENGPVIEAKAIDYRTSAAFDPNDKTQIKNMTYDWGLITLDRPIGQDVGFLGVVNLDREAFSRLLAREPIPTFARAGYRADAQKSAGLDLGCPVFGFFDDIELLQHRCPIQLGDSGGPILALLPEGPSIIGVQSGRLSTRTAWLGTAVPASSFYQSIGFTKAGQTAGAADHVEGYSGAGPQGALAITAAPPPGEAEADAEPR